MSLIRFYILFQLQRTRRRDRRLHGFGTEVLSFLVHTQSWRKNIREVLVDVKLLRLFLLELLASLLCGM